TRCLSDWSSDVCSSDLAPGVCRRAVHSIYDCAKRQAHLIDELLDVSRIIAGKLRLERGTVDLAEIVRGAVEVVQPSAYAKHIDRSEERRVGEGGGQRRW